MKCAGCDRDVPARLVARARKESKALVCSSCGCETHPGAGVTFPYVVGSATSRAAATAVKGSTAAKARARVRAFIAAQGSHGATDDEVQVALDMNPSTQRPRRVELVKSGLVRDSGTTRATRSGRKATVWVVT